MRRLWLLGSLGAALVLAAVGASPRPAAAQGRPPDPAAVVLAGMAAVNTGNLAAVEALLAADATLEVTARAGDRGPAHRRPAGAPRLLAPGGGGGRPVAARRAAPSGRRAGDRGGAVHRHGAARPGAGGAGDRGDDRGGGAGRDRGGARGHAGAAGPVRGPPGRRPPASACPAPAQWGATPLAAAAGRRRGGPDPDRGARSALAAPRRVAPPAALTGSPRRRPQPRRLRTPDGGDRAWSSAPRPGGSGRGAGLSPG